MAKTGRQDTRPNQRKEEDMTAKQKISELHDKYYKGKPGRRAKQEAKVKKVIKDKKALKALEAPKVTPAETPGEAIDTGLGIDAQVKTTKQGTRAALMTEAQKRGIKYFRILTKEELAKVLADSISPQEITVIQQAAQERWKAGWGSRKKA